MRMRTLTICVAMGLLASVAASSLSPTHAQKPAIELQWWHAMTGANGDRVNKIAEGFNATQSEYKVVPSFKGSYDETMTASIAAFRSGSAPHIVQVYEVGTATMMAAKGAVKPVYQLMADAGEPFDAKSYLPAITGYYSTADGKMLSMPFNSSSAVTYYNKEAFKKAGLDPEKPPKTWPELFEAAKKIRATNAAPCGFTSAWVSWIQLEQFSAWHNVPLATKANGLAGMDAELKFNGPLQTKHLQALVDAQKDRVFEYGGRTTQPEGKWSSGECAIILNSSAYVGIALANAKFPFGVAAMPYYPDVAGAPQNSIIGGASLWVLAGKKPEEYKGVAKFFSYLSRTDVQVDTHEVTGYLPLTVAAYKATKDSGFYEKNPGRETPILELQNKPPTENSMGLRLGNMVQLRDVFAEEIENALGGKASAKDALDKAVARGNAILRQFQKANS
jgi:sn-glycerol 3-phosphate transport system substrate-binding protein